MPSLPSHPRSIALLVAGLAAAAAAVPTTAFGIVDDMGPGWNLGNTMDGTGGETGWSNPKTTQQMIDAVHKAGFRTLRLPVRWDEHMSGSGYTIETAWMDRVEEIANYALKDSMYVIVNIHHNDGWEDPVPSNEANSKDHLVKIWTQIANRFKPYDNRVVFETMNEPRKQNPDDWSGNTTDYQIVNRLNAAALQAIRATGGNNATRLVTMPGYAANNDSRMQYTVIPSDPMVAAAVHSYDPQAICFGSGGQTAMTSSDKTFIDNMFAQVNSTFVKKGIPVVMGEWAPTNKNNTASRAELALYFCQSARKNRVPVILWDNGNTSVSSDGMGFLDRKQAVFAFPTIVEAMVKGQPSGALAGRTAVRRLEVVPTPRGTRFATSFDCLRYEVSDLSGRTTVLPGGRSAWLPAGSTGRGLRIVRGIGPDAVETARFLAP